VPDAREQVLEKILEDFLIAVMQATREAEARIRIDVYGFRPILPGNNKGA
jgi:hypothetical protein